MKPLNYDNSPCSPISSNCVIWQGPDIPCIKLCAGDTISDVIFKLATELCTVLDTLNVTNYDLSCFNLTACGPNDFQALIQFLIEQICALQSEVAIVSDPATSPITNDPTKSTGANTLVTVAPCFVVGGVTVMTVSQYAQAIGTRVCSLVSQISTINSQITDLEVRVTDLENATVVIPPTPSIIIDCNIGTLVSGNSYTIDTVLDELINNTTNGLCSYTNTSTGVLGTPSQLLTSYITSCSYGTDVTSDPNWTATPTTLPETITNIFIALCVAYSNTTTIAVANTSSINLTISSGPAYNLSAKETDSGWVDLNGFAFYGVGVPKPQCRRIGNQIHLRGTVFVPLEDPSSPGSVVVLSSTSAYNSITGCTTWSGVGGCSISAFGSISFNNGGAVIPPSVTAGNLDNTYFKAWDVALRPIDVDPTYGTCLASAIRVSLTATKGLTVQLVHDIEVTTTRGAGVQGNSPLRFITSNVRVGEYLPNYIGTGTDIHNAPSNTNFPLLSDTFNLTWPFSCDAGDENQIGGFYFVIDGLVAYVDPCNTETGFSTVCP
jgi:hypothetical protein